MTEEVTNPPVFPVRVTRTNSTYPLATYEHQFEGITLRDWFAGQALAHSAEMSYAEYFGKGGNRDARRMTAEHCYDIADAMLAARAKVPS